MSGLATQAGTDSSDTRPSWEQVQEQLADMPGEDGVRRRRDAYRPYFLRFGHDVRIAERCRFAHPGRIEIDDDVRINIGALIYGSGGVRMRRWKVRSRFLTFRNRTVPLWSTPRMRPADFSWTRNESYSSTWKYSIGSKQLR
jgi:hypothetical protein